MAAHDTPSGSPGVLGAVVGVLSAIENGAPLVSFRGSAAPVGARTVVDLAPADIGREVLLVFEGGDARQPVITGLLRASGAPTAPRRLVLAAGEEIVLQCGLATITLTRAGKVLVRGAYILSRSSGVNRIKGGSVQVN